MARIGAELLEDCLILRCIVSASELRSSSGSESEHGEAFFSQRPGLVEDEILDLSSHIYSRRGDTEDALSFQAIDRENDTTRHGSGQGWRDCNSKKIECSVDKDINWYMLADLDR